MALLRLSKRSCVFLVLFLVVNPLPGLLARSDTKPYSWQNRGCRAVFNAIRNNVKINPEDLLRASSAIKVDPFDKELHGVFNRVVEIARANPDKVSGAGSVAALLGSACLLYDSILLTHGIRLFLDKFQELRGRFNAFVVTKLPKIEKLLIETDSDLIETGRVVLQHLKEIDDVLDKVRDLIVEASVAEWDAKFTTAVSFTFAVAAGIAASPIVPIKGLVFKCGMGAASILSGAAAGMSLRNVNDCKLAQREMREFKKKVEDLKSQAWDWMLEMKMH